MMGKFSPDLIEGQLVQDRGNIAGPKQWPHTHALGAMYAGGPV